MGLKFTSFSPLVGWMKFAVITRYQRRSPVCDSLRIGLVQRVLPAQLIASHLDGGFFVAQVALQTIWNFGHQMLLN